MEVELNISVVVDTALFNRKTVVLRRARSVRDVEVSDATCGKHIRLLEVVYGYSDLHDTVFVALSINVSGISLLFH